MGTSTRGVGGVVSTCVRIYSLEHHFVVHQFTQINYEPHDHSHQIQHKYSAHLIYGELKGGLRRALSWCAIGVCRLFSTILLVQKKVEVEGEVRGVIRYMRGDIVGYNEGILIECLVCNRMC